MRYKVLLVAFLLIVAIAYPKSPDVPAVRQIVLKSGINQDDLGMIVQENQKTIFQMNSDTPFVPASLTKVLTGAASIETLGPSYVFRTQLYEKGTMQGKVFKGSLYLKGGGDPTFHSYKLATLLKNFTAKGFRGFEGEIIIDDSRFDDYHSSDWKTAQAVLRDYKDRTFPLFVKIDPPPGQAPSAKDLRSIIFSPEKDLVVYKNMTEPDLWTGKQIIQQLQQKKIQVKANVQRGSMPEDVRLAGEIITPLRTAVHLMMKKSDNYIAETLTRNMAVQAKGTPVTIDVGLESMRYFLDHVGIPRADYTLLSASGFSHQNVIRPAAFCRLLNYVDGRPELFKSLIESFPIAGVDGTLRSRMGKTPAKGLVLAKTGYLQNSAGFTSVVGLAGYINRPDGGRLTFVFIYNGYKPAALARNLFDEICVQLVN